MERPAGPRRVLLTRAAEDAERTRAALEAMGHEVVLAPLLRIMPLPAPWPGGPVDALLATSGHAFSAQAEGWGPSAEARRLLPLLVVGTRTRESAVARGYLGPATVTANAAALALALSKRAARAARIVYLAGRDRKPDVEAALRVTKQPFELVETYEARAIEAIEPDALAALGRDAVDVALHFSQRSGELFVAGMRAAGLDPDRLDHLCLSEDVAAPLRRAGCGRVRVAQAANEAALLACLDAVDQEPGGPDEG